MCEFEMSFDLLGQSAQGEERVSEPTKVCRKCNVEKPLTEFGKNKNSKDGKRSECKACRKKWYADHSEECIERSRVYRLNNPELVKENMAKAYRKDIDKSRAQSRENHRKNKDKETATHKIYKEEHKEEIAASTKKYREEHKEETAATQKLYRETHKEELAEKRKIHDKENAEELAKTRQGYTKKYQATHMKDVIARTLKYMKTPKGIASSLRAVHKRRTYSEGQPSTLTNDEWVEIILKQGGKCAHCGRDFSEDLLPTRDHIIPLSHPDCPGFVSDNIQALCLSCNSRKGKRTEKELEEYLKSVGREKTIYSLDDNLYINRETLGGFLRMSEVVGKEAIVREKGYLYCIKSTGFIWRVPAKSNKTGTAKQVGKEQIKKEPGYLYFVGSDGRAARSPMKNAASKQKK